MATRTSICQLCELEGATVAFLDLAESLGRPLLNIERRSFRFLLMAWESADIKREFIEMPDERLSYYTTLMVQLRELICPDPVRQLRLRRQKPEEVAQLHDGNFAVKAAPFKGVSVRRLDMAEAMERVQLMARLADGIRVLARELSLVQDKDRAEARRIAKAGCQIAEMAQVFTGRCEPVVLSAKRSMEEIMDDMSTMGELMGEA